MGLRPDHLVGFADPRRALDADRRRLPEVGADAVVALERRLDDLLLDLPVERYGDLVPGVVLAHVDERILLGELGQGRPEGALLLRLPGEDDGLEGRPWETSGRFAARLRRPDRITDPDRAEPADRRHLARREDIATRGPSRGEDADRARLRAPSPADRYALARTERAGEQAGVGDPLARGCPLDLEDAARHGCLRIALRAAEELVDAREQLVDADPVGCRAEEHRVDDAAPRLNGQLLAQPTTGSRRLATHIGLEDRFVMLGEDLRERDPMGFIVRTERPHGRGTTARVADGLHRHDRGRKTAPECLDDPRRIRTGAVDLVDEDQRGDAQSLERPEEERRLGLDALDRRDDQDRPIEHREHALDLGDEVGMARRVDQVDREVAYAERGDG